MHASKKPSDAFRSLSPAAKAFIVYGLLYDIVLNLYKPFGPTFLQRVGGGAAEIFFFNSMPALFSAAILIPSLFIIKAMGDSGRAGFIFLCASRLLLLAAACLPFFPPQLRAWGFIIIVSAIVMLESASQSALQAYIGQALESKERASAISRRLAAGQIFIAFILIATGLLLRFLPSLGIDQLALYQGLFLFAFAFSIAELAAFKRLISQGGRQRLETAVVPSLKRMAKDRGFLAFAGSALVFYFGWQLGWPIFSVWQVKYLGADEAWLAVYAVVASLVQFASFPLWRKIIEKRGLAFSLVLATLGQAVNPIAICLCDTALLQVACLPFTAFFTAGIVVCFLAGLLSKSPDTGDRISYMAVFNTMLNISQVVSQQLGLSIYKATDIRAAMLIDAGLRTVGAAAFISLWLRARNKKAPAS